MAAKPKHESSRNRIVIKRATSADSRAISQFANKEIMHSMHYNFASRKEYASKVTTKYIRSVIGSGGAAVIAMHNKEMVGCLWATFDSADRSIMYFEWTLVAKPYRGHDLAYRMHMDLEKLVMKEGVRKIWGDSRASNYQAINLEKKLGIRTIGKLKRHWFGQDYIFWEKQLKKTRKRHAKAKSK